MTAVSVRYIADDVDAAVDFYVERLGFDVEMRPGPRGGSQILLDDPSGNPIELFQPAGA